ncbi:hypothetical protein PV04_02071 [Phialophora macrospora]|uniref:Uncharacterized protein n=1 Tax=Phialophora macrospora TaxID=1851006 RepID=A0A0D2GNR5_9EURO|nr:hypothetical protein PV04_02071 [Phialophora macrospora]
MHEHVNEWNAGTHDSSGVLSWASCLDRTRRARPARGPLRSGLDAREAGDPIRREKGGGVELWPGQRRQTDVIFRMFTAERTARAELNPGTTSAWQVCDLRTSACTAGTHTRPSLDQTNFQSRTASWMMCVAREEGNVHEKRARARLLWYM